MATFLLLFSKRKREIWSCRKVELTLRRENELTLLVVLAAARAGTDVLLSFESAASANGAALVACYPHPLYLFICIIHLRLSHSISSRSGLVEPFQLPERSSATFHAFIGTLITSFYSLSSIAGVRA